MSLSQKLSICSTLTWIKPHVKHVLPTWTVVPTAKNIMKS